MIKHVVQWSGGAASAYAGKRVIDKFGKDSTVFLFADVKMEDDDLYRFNKEACAYLGMELTVISDGRTPWDVFFDERFLGNSRVDPCSKILKRELLWSWIERNAPQAVVSVGIDWSEEHRLERLRTYRPEFTIDSPLLWKPLVEKPTILNEIINVWKIKPCSLYDKGFSHANCGGFCIKSGQAQFRLLLLVYPERYAYHERREEELRHFLQKDVSILRDRRGGVVKPLTLRAFRERIEAGGSHDKHDWGGCGCALE